MSREARQNLQAINLAVKATTRQAIDGRNDFLRRYWLGIDSDIRDDLLYIHGSQNYKNKTLDQFFGLIDTRSIALPIKFIGGNNDNALLARAAVEMSDLVYTRAMRVKDTGVHAASLTMYAREVGTREYFLIPPGPINPNLLPERTVISVVALAEYSNTLELTTAGGILYFAAQQMRRRYPLQLAVRFDYISGTRLGGKGGSFPRVQIGHIGNERNKQTRRGRKAKIHAPL